MGFINDLKSSLNENRELISSAFVKCFFYIEFFHLFLEDFAQSLVTVTITFFRMYNSEAISESKKIVAAPA